MMGSLVQGVGVVYIIRLRNHWKRSPIVCTIQFRMTMILGTVLEEFLLPPIFLGNPGMFPDCARTCKFRRNSSSFESATKILSSLLLNSWCIFLVTLLSIASKAWIIEVSTLHWLHEELWLLTRRDWGVPPGCPSSEQLAFFFFQSYHSGNKPTVLETELVLSTLIAKNNDRNISGTTDYHLLCNIFVSSLFIFFISTFSFWRETNSFTRQVKAKSIEKYWKIGSIKDSDGKKKTDFTPFIPP